MTEIVIASAARTPIGSFGGAFAATPAHELGRVAVTAALQRAKVEPKEVSEVVLGQVLQAAQGMNPTGALVAAPVPVTEVVRPTRVYIAPAPWPCYDPWYDYHWGHHDFHHRHHTHTDIHFGF